MHKTPHMAVLSDYKTPAIAQVLMHWACSKMSAAGDLADGPLMERVAGKLKGHKGIRFTQLASHAQGLGRRGLAALLLDLESSAAEQVSLLLYPFPPLLFFPSPPPPPTHTHPPRLLDGGSSSAMQVLTPLFPFIDGAFSSRSVEDTKPHPLHQKRPLAFLFRSAFWKIVL